MTEQELRNMIVSTAASYLGVTEGSAKHKEIIDIYNSYKDPNRRSYKMTVKDSWCMTFVSVCFIKSDLADLIVTECGCGEAITRNKEHKNNWIENDAYTPKPGDIIMYDWDDSGSGDNTGWPDHTGIVESCDGKNIVIIEGNYSDAVKKRKLSLNGKYIRGFIMPDYTSKADKVSSNISGIQATSELWIRKSPINGSPVIAMPKGARVQKLSNPWVKVRYEKDGKVYEGWSSMKYLKEI